MTDDDLLTRFRAVDHLFGAGAVERLQTAHVGVVGLGGVGSWVVEALARSGVGRLTLIDLDEVCLSNVNRQLPALDGTVGRFKAEVLADRVRAIHPACDVRPRIEFFTESSADRLLEPRYDVVVDAIDTLGNKCRLIAGCAARAYPVVVCGGAGGRRDPTRVRQVDLADASHDRLLAEVRRTLRRDHGFPVAGQPWGIPAIHSIEPVARRTVAGPNCGVGDEGRAPDFETGSESGVPAGRRLNCEGGLGSAAFVTGAFGLVAAACAVEVILANR
ncbi:MAG: ThiF family adenylyltransferase [Limisphaerales bacterium]